MASLHLYFRSTDTAGKSTLYVSDGTTSGTKAVSVAGANAAGVAPSSFAVLGNNVLFAGADSAGKQSLFVLDGASNAAAPLRVNNSFAGPNGLAPSGLETVGSLVFFKGRDLYGGYNLYVTDGTSAGTYELPYRFAAPAGLSPTVLTAFGGRLYFAGQAGKTLASLFVSDGTAVGTNELVIAGASANGLDVGAIGSLGNRLLFDGRNAANKRVLFVSDGTAARTTQLAIPGLNPTGSVSGRPSGMIAFGNRVAFTAGDANGRTGVWVSDGTVGGTFELPGVFTNSFGAPMTALTGNRLAFIATDAAGRSGVYVTDGISVTVRIVPPGTGDGVLQPRAVMTFGNQLMFDGQVPGVGRSLFVSDGTIAGTSVLAPGVPLAAGNIINNDAVAVGTPALPAYIGYVDATSGAAAAVQMAPVEVGGPSYLEHQFIYAGSHDMAMSTQAPNVFVHSGSGNDALQVASGQNVLDGGLGSNFMTGGSGTDTFFTDARSPGVVWNTIRNFHAGDAMTLWGFDPAVSSYRWEPSLQGARGSEGATLRANIVGGGGRIGDGIDASVTFAGLSVEQAQRLQIVSGAQPAGSYLFVYNPGV